ncbi:unnamed protein product [Cuscuta campestris]|uniref:F-box domain-containing protein n=2 Tax=Cuscuta sect. Cleistogrammica TaxID=1824901 RepID=A0A484K737_9ASTE|nr:hypothetical protein DM860_009405 [Cuscuta australis]VFQ61781.1 unnamed protein product [Cuscuta campestris]
MWERHHLPEEILIEILTRLPVRSLVRFTAVSKSWFFLITSPALVSAHLRHSRCNDNSVGNLLLLRHLENSSIKEKYEILEETDHQTLNPISSPELPPAFACEDIRVVGCYSGVVCLSNAWCCDLCCTYLWNPCIQKLKPLSPPTIIRPAGSLNSLLGFGVNPECDGDLKVVRAVYQRKGEYLQMPDGPPDVEIYLLSTGKWRTISAVGVNLYMINFVLWWSQTFVHGAVHWIGQKWVDNVRSKCCITVFSMADEVFSEIMLPNELAKWIALYLHIMMFEESIAVAKYATRNHCIFCDLWVMKEYGVVESWCRIYRIELDGWMDRIVGFRKNGDILICSDNRELVSYCPTTKFFHKLGIYGTNRSFYVGKYLESLVLLQEKSCEVDVLFKEMTSVSI